MQLKYYLHISLVTKEANVLSFMQVNTHSMYLNMAAKMSQLPGTKTCISRWCWQYIVQQLEDTHHCSGHVQA